MIVLIGSNEINFPILEYRLLRSSIFTATVIAKKCGELLPGTASTCVLPPPAYLESIYRNNRLNPGVSHLLNTI